MQAGQEARVQVVNDAQVARQQPAHQIHRPGFQRFLHQRVVGVAEDAAAQRPGAVPVQSVLVHQQAHQFRHRQRRMRVVEVDCHLVGQRIEAAVAAQVTAQQVLQRGADEEVLLAQPQLFAVVGAVVRVEHARDVFGLVLGFHRAHVVALVESIEVDDTGGSR